MSKVRKNYRFESSTVEKLSLIRQELEGKLGIDLPETKVIEIAINELALKFNIVVDD